MKFKNFGNIENPTIILIHGGGLSWWSLESIIAELDNAYHIVTPIIDGHGEDGETEFVSIQDTATKLIKYIDLEFEGHVFAIGGLSIGAQIVTEVLATRLNIAKYAIIESALVFPIKGTKTLTVPTFKLFYGLVNKRWFSKLQAKTLYVPETMFEQYYQDSLCITKQSLINIALSNGSYKLNDAIANTKSKVLIIVGEKEINIMKKSAHRLHDLIPNSQLNIAEDMKHGEISLVHTQEYLALIKSFIS
jgi:pimeloyl-ACP methyl ester carboxylesterase